jgi:hypothetical protein
MARAVWLLAGLLLVGSGLITTGAWLIYRPAGFIVGGILLIAWSMATIGTVTIRDK